MRILRTVIFIFAGAISANVMAAEYTMSCEEVITKLNREATDAAKARFADLSGSCMGVTERDGALYMHTKVVVRRVRGNRVTLYLPATDRTFEVTPDASSRVEIAGRKIRPRDLSRGQELNIYVSVDKFTEEIIDEIVFETEEEEFVAAPAVIAPALPTTG
jgi:hypothetical protein